MQRRNIRKSFWSSSLLFQIIVACVFGLTLGIACGYFSGSLVFGGMAAVLLVYAILKRPEIALLGILITTASIVFEEQLPMVSVGISLHIPDFLLLGSFGLIALRWVVEPEFKIVRTPLDWPLLIFCGVNLLATFVAIFQSSLETEEARRGIRVLSYYLAFFVVTNVVRERRQLNFLLGGLFLLATVVAVAMIAQYLVGTSVAIIPGYVQNLKTQSSSYENVVRILPPGVSIVLLAFVTNLCTLILEKFTPARWLKVTQIGLLGMAFSLTFLRSFFAALVMVLFLLWFIIRGPDRQKFFNWGVVSVFLAVVILLFVSSVQNPGATSFVSASVDRYSTLFEPETFQGQDSSLNWRKIENGYAIRAIMSHPWIGMGVRFMYRPWDYRLDGAHPDPLAFDFRRFIHNGHLWILLQSGLLGYASLTWLSIAFLMRGFKYWRSVSDLHLQGVVLGFALFYLVILIAAVANSTFMQWNWVSVIGIIMGINETILNKFKEE